MYALSYALTEIRCSTPPVLHRAVASATSDVVNTNITYTCMDHFVFQTGWPALTMTCGVDGNWSIDHSNSMNVTDQSYNIEFLPEDCKSNWATLK